MSSKKKIYLSPPHMSGLEQGFIDEAFDSNWIAPVGSNIDGFEKDIKTFLNTDKHVVALNSGTSSIHLALQLLGVSKGDEVICQSFTFSASVNPIIYQGAVPVFVDSETDTWNMCPQLLETAIKARINAGKKPKAILVVDSYGMPCKANAINTVAKKYDIPVVEDAAAALGSTYFDSYCGSLCDFGILSFNGNKIITTSAGGTLLVNSEELKNKAIFIATQAKEETPYYEHSTIGFNYRMSNVLAGIGRGQMKVLADRIHARKQNFDFYKNHLSLYDEVSFLKDLKNTSSNRWLTCMELTSNTLRESIRIALLKDNVESRPLWKPMHLQPIFKDYLSFTNGVSEKLFKNGLCLPSGSSLKEVDLNRIINTIREVIN